MRALKGMLGLKDRMASKGPTAGKGTAERKDVAVVRLKVARDSKVAMIVTSGRGVMQHPKVHRVEGIASGVSSAVARVVAHGESLAGGRVRVRRAAQRVRVVLEIVAGRRSTEVSSPGETAREVSRVPGVTPAVELAQVRGVARTLVVAQVPGATLAVAVAQIRGVMLALGVVRVPAVTPAVEIAQIRGVTPALGVARVPAVTPAVEAAQPRGVMPALKGQVASNVMRVRRVLVASRVTGGRRARSSRKHLETNGLESCKSGLMRMPARW